MTRVWGDSLYRLHFVELSHPVNFQVATIYQTFSYFDFCPHSLLFKIPLSPMTEEINYINPPIQLVFNFYFLFQTLFTSSVQLHPLTNNSFWTFQPNFLFNFFCSFSKTCFPKLSLKSTFTTDHLNQLLLFQQDHSCKLTRATPSQLSKWEQRYHAAPWKKGIYPIKKSIVG